MENLSASIHLSVFLSILFFTSLSCPTPTNLNFEKVLAVRKADASKPTANEAGQDLFDKVKGLKIENATFRPDLLAALFFPSFETEKILYKSLSIPETMDEGGLNIARYIID